VGSLLCGAATAIGDTIGQSSTTPLLRLLLL
jgi:hypothetical protein